MVLVSNMKLTPVVRFIASTLEYIACRYSTCQVLGQENWTLWSQSRVFATGTDWSSFRGCGSTWVGIRPLDSGTRSSWSSHSIFGSLGPEQVPVWTWVHGTQFLVCHPCSSGNRRCPAKGSGAHGISQARSAVANGSSFGQTEHRFTEGMLAHPPFGHASVSPTHVLSDHLPLCENVDGRTLAKEIEGPCRKKWGCVEKTRNVWVDTWQGSYRHWRQTDIESQRLVGQTKRPRKISFFLEKLTF